MKVKELIALLEKIDNKEATVEVAINQCNKLYPVHYGQICSREYLQSNGLDHRIDVYLPDNMYTATKKVKS